MMDTMIFRQLLEIAPDPEKMAEVLSRQLKDCARRIKQEKKVLSVIDWI